MGQAALEGHLMVPAQDQLQEPQMEMVVTAQEQMVVDTSNGSSDGSKAQGSTGDGTGGADSGGHR